MRESEVKRYQLEFEGWIESWKSFGRDLIDAGSPNPCSRSPGARKCFHGRWREAYDMWLKDGEFSRIEEHYVAFMLATEKIINKGRSVEVPKLPRRIWSEAEYKKAVHWYTTDIPFRNQTIAHLLSPGKTEWCRQRHAIGALVKANQPEEAERLFHEFQWDQEDLAENNLALIRTCAAAGVGSDNEYAMWFYSVGGRRGGPVRYDQLRAAFQQGKLLGTCLVWREGMTGWQHAAQVKCFAPVVYSGALPPPLPSLK
jgi:hypothetical protein